MSGAMTFRMEENHNGGQTSNEGRGDGRRTDERRIREEYRRVKKYLSDGARSQLIDGNSSKRSGRNSEPSVIGQYYHSLSVKVSLAGTTGGDQVEVGLSRISGGISMFRI